MENFNGYADQSPVRWWLAGPVDAPAGGRVCPCCNHTIMYFVEYWKRGGTLEQWNDPRVVIVCCSCMNLMLDSNGLGIDVLKEFWKRLGHVDHVDICLGKIE